MSVPAHRFIGKDQKRGFCCKILGFAMTFTGIFVLELKFAYVRGGTSSIFGGTVLKMCSSGTRPATLFWCTIFAGGAQFSL